MDSFFKIPLLGLINPLKLISGPPFVIKKIPSFSIYGAMHMLISYTWLQLSLTQAYANDM